MELVDSVPIGYKFHPTEEELVVRYLDSYVAGKPPLSCAVAFADVYGTEPWNLLGSGRQEGYFFAERKPKSSGGSRVDRKAGTGHWTLSFNDGRRKNSGWSMYEYEMSSSGFQRIVLCHVKRNSPPAVSGASFVGQKRNGEESTALSATAPTLSKKPSWGSVAHSSRASRFDVSPPPPPMVVQHPSLLPPAVTPPERSLPFVDSPTANEAPTAKIPAVDDGGGDLGITKEMIDATSINTVRYESMLRPPPAKRSLSFVDSPAANEAPSAKIPAVDDGGGDLGITMEMIEALMPSTFDHGGEQMYCPVVDHSFKSLEALSPSSVDHGGEQMYCPVVDHSFKSLEPLSPSSVDHGGEQMYCPVVDHSFKSLEALPSSSVDHGGEQMCCPAVDHSFKSLEALSPSSVDHGGEQMCCPAVDHSFKSPEEVETFLMSDDTFTAYSTADTRRLAEIEADLMSDGTITAASTTIQPALLRCKRECTDSAGLTTPKVLRAWWMSDFDHR